MFDIAWCDKYNLSVLSFYFVNSFHLLYNHKITLRMCDDI